MQKNAFHAPVFLFAWAKMTSIHINQGLFIFIGLGATHSASQCLKAKKTVMNAYARVFALQSL